MSRKKWNSVKGLGLLRLYKGSQDGQASTVRVTAEQI